MIKSGAIRYNINEITFNKIPYNGDKEKIVRFVAKAKGIAVIDPSVN